MQDCAARCSETICLLTNAASAHVYAVAQGVEGVLIAGNNGQIHKTTLSEQLTQDYASQIPSLAALARNVIRDLDPQVCWWPKQQAASEMMGPDQGTSLMLPASKAIP